MRAVCVQHSLTVLGIAMLLWSFIAPPSAHAQESEELFVFATPTFRRADIDEWIRQTLPQASNEATALRGHYEDFCEDWATATQSMRTKRAAYVAERQRWEDGGMNGPGPDFDPELWHRMVLWRRDRIHLENNFLSDVAELLGTHDAWESWRALVATARRRAVLPLLGNAALLPPITDLLALLDEIGIDHRHSGLSRIAADCAQTLDDAVAAIEYRWFDLPERGLTSDEARYQSMSLMRPLYQLNIRFAEVFLTALVQPDNDRFEQAWNALWYPQLATPTPTPADLAISRLRGWLPPTDHRTGLIDEIAHAYASEKHHIDRKMMEADPPSKQLRWVDPDFVQEHERTTLQWWMEAENRPYAVFETNTHLQYRARIELIRDTCRRLRALFAEDELPVDIDYLLFS